MAVKRKTLRWRITRIRGNRAELLGVVTAADEKSAIRTAIKEYKIDNPEQQRRLARMHPRAHAVPRLTACAQRHVINTVANGTGELAGPARTPVQSKPISAP
jgi:hypothetical protein